jgi:hypothetical protein
VEVIGENINIYVKKNISNILTIWTKKKQWKIYYESSKLYLWIYDYKDKIKLQTNYMKYVMLSVDGQICLNSSTYNL